MNNQQRANLYHLLGVNVIPLDELQPSPGLDVAKFKYNPAVFLDVNGLGSYGTIVTRKGTTANLKKVGENYPWLAHRPDGGQIIYVMVPTLKEPELTPLPPSLAFRGGDRDISYRFANIHLFTANGQIPNELPIVWED